MTLFEPVDSSETFPQIEERVLARWRASDVFQQSLEQRADSEPFVFFEGPPTANGRPGSHHVLSRVFKDIFPRYKTMRGYRVNRKAGWDCHGLPVELEVERRLGLSSKDEIERFGIAEFNERCRASVFEYVEEWNRLTERIGFWIDLDDPYRTLDHDYVESVWWSLKQIWERRDASGDRFLYEGHRVVPYCPRCGTALSSHEVALGYKDVVDQSAYVRFPVADTTSARLEEGDALLVWTTTPWTLMANVAVAVAADVGYVRARAAGEVLILAEALVKDVLGDDAEILSRIPGQELVGSRYSPPFTLTDQDPSRSCPVIAGDFVTTDDGTGLVHIAPAFGEDDYRVAAEYGIFDPTIAGTLSNPVRLDGTYDNRAGKYSGRFVKDADPDLIEELRERGLLFAVKPYEHAYPHCWRCATPLIYYAKTSWYIKTTAVRDELLAGNQAITWHPEHIKHGRFGKWLENNVDWALSRERYWGTPLPIWRCEQGHTVCVGSFAEIAERGGAIPDDPHRPYVDDVVLTCEQCAGPMRRVPEVIDAWYDSGAMPFAQWHYPFENAELFAERFPADYICEALDQTRGWFYSLLAVSTLLFERPSYETVLCLGLILDPDGQKMSKSRGNVVVPWEVIDRHGADAFRWYYFTAKEPWAGYRFSVETVGESVRRFLLTLWNTFGFFVLYANAGDEDGAGARAPGERDDLDRWAISRLHALTETARERLDAYDATAAGRAISEYVDELSNWYVRRSRRRFWNAEPDALATLRECLVGVAKLVAPFTPFIADEIYTRLSARERDHVPDSVHLCDYPEPDPALRDEQLEREMAVARETVELGRAARAQATIKVRQPLAEAVVVATGVERTAIARYEGLIADELNVKSIRFVDDADELVGFEIRPNFRALGPRFGDAMPAAKAAIAALDGDTAAARLRRGEHVGVVVGGQEHSLGPDELQVVFAPLRGYQLERDGSHAVALDLTITDELRREGVAREIVHAVQNARKNAGFAVEDRIRLDLAGDTDLIEAARVYHDYVATETLATDLHVGDKDLGEGADGATLNEVSIDGRPLRIGVRQV